MADVVKMTARDVNRALYWHFAGRWAPLTEVTARPDPELVEQYRRGRIYHRDLPPPRRIDVLLVKANKKLQGGVERLAIEVKVDRGDFLADVRNPDKQAPWRDLAHRHAYAVPDGLVSPAEVPATSGLLVVKRSSWSASHYTVDWARRAPRPAGHDPGPLPLPNIMDAFWRASRAEARAKGLSLRDGDDTPEELRAKADRLEHELELARKRIDREVDLRQQWQRRYAAHGAPACGTCGRPLHPTRKRHSDQWEHRDQDDAATCLATRTAAAQAADDALPETQRMGRYRYVPGPEPADTPILEGSNA